MSCAFVCCELGLIGVMYGNKRHATFFFNPTLENYDQLEWDRELIKVFDGRYFFALLIAVRFIIIMDLVSCCTLHVFA